MPGPLAAEPVDLKASELINGPKVGPMASREPSPNRGASIPDFQAIGENHVKKADWLKDRNIDQIAQVKLVKLAHMRYQHPDLAQITTFLRDFGLHVVKKTETERWYCGFGPDQYVYYARQGPKAFLGGAFEVESEEELEKVTKIPNIQIISQGIEEMTNAPGGGKILTVNDPEGFPVNFIYGQAHHEPAARAPQPKLIVNDEVNKPRQRQFQRFVEGPAEVYKLGHYGLVVNKFQEQMDWYTRHFNIIPSDILYLPAPDSTPESPKRFEVAMFAHVNRGSDPMDHHSLFLSSAQPGGKHHVHHCSFEVHDFDTQALGHQWLAGKKYESVWGVGRHILGSQIFDYWWDTTGNMVEHYADGDLVTIETPMGYAPAGHEGLAVWGPEVPAAFLN